MKIDSKVLAQKELNNLLTNIFPDAEILEGGYNSPIIVKKKDGTKDLYRGFIKRKNRWFGSIWYCGRKEAIGIPIRDGSFKIDNEGIKPISTFKLILANINHLK